MGTETLNSYTSTGITLTAAGADNSPFTVTSAGTIITSGAFGVYSELASPFLLNEGSISATGGSGLAGVLLADGGTIDNGAGGVIQGRLDGVVIDKAAGTVSNAGTIEASNVNGVFLAGGGTVINTGTIAASRAVYIEGAGGARVVAGGGAVFDGTVQAKGTGNTLEFAGAGGTVASIGGQFTGFQTVAFDAGAAWTISGDEAALSGLAGITGFGAGDEADLTGFVATAASYIAGTGLVLSNASGSETLAFSGGPGVYSIEGDGNGGTDILFGTHTLSTANTTGIALTAAGPYFGPFTVTPTGTIAGSGVSDVYSHLSQPYLLNQGTIALTGNNAVLFKDGGTVVNAGTIVDAFPANFVPNSGVDIDGEAGTVSNTGSIIGNALLGVYLGAGGTVINLGRSALISGDDAAVRSASGTVLNSGTLIGTYGSGIAFFNGSGLVVNSTSYAVIYDGAFAVTSADTVINDGTIMGGSGGVNLRAGGTVTNSGTIAGGTEAIYGQGAFTLNELAGGVFDGSVAAHGGGGVLNLAGGTAGSLDMDGSFSGFSAINFGPAGWTLDGTSGELAGGETITGFTLGDEIDLTDFAATAASYIAGTGLVLSNATASETVDFTGGNGEIAITADGHGGTNIQFGTHTLSTSTSAGITLTAGGPDLDPFTVTGTGTIVSGGYGVYSSLAGAYLLNQGFITSSSTTGVDLRNGGTVINAGRSAFIYGYVFGVGGQAGTVLNTGTIAAHLTFGVGMFTQGGVVSNAASYAVISGGAAGVGLEAADATLSNSGTVTAVAFGVEAAGSGDVIANTGSHALIAGTFFPSVFVEATDVTLINAGTIGGRVNAVEAVDSGFTLDERAGGVFENYVVDQAHDGVLDLGGSSAGTLDMRGTFSGFSAISFGAAAWTLGGTGTEIAGGQTITGFGKGDALDITDLDFVAREVLTLGPSDVLTIAQGTATVDVTFASGDIGGHFTVSADGAGGSLVTDDVACFCAGTRIRTPRGEVAVEALAAGDVVVTMAGERAVKWIGKRRLFLTRHPRPETVQPICFEAGCLGEGVPARDLYVSPDHALYLEGILVPAKVLLNGGNIAQLTLPVVTYYHVELDEHGVIFAENTPAESYLETGNRGAFENGGGAVTLHPDFAQGLRAGKSCAPFMEDGPMVEAIRRRILDRARIATTRDPALTIAYREGGAVIESRHAVPGLLTHDPRDRRRLGVKIGGILADGREIPVGHPALVEGWHEAEPDGRWTDGHAVIPAEVLGGASEVRVVLVGTVAYPMAA